MRFAIGLVAFSICSLAQAETVLFQPTTPEGRNVGAPVTCNVTKRGFNYILIEPLSGSSLGGTQPFMKLDWKGCGANGRIVGSVDAPKKLAENQGFGVYQTTDGAQIDCEILRRTSTGGVIIKSLDAKQPLPNAVGGNFLKLGKSCSNTFGEFYETLSANEEPKAAAQQIAQLTHAFSDSGVSASASDASAVHLGVNFTSVGAAH